MTRRCTTSAASGCSCAAVPRFRPALIARVRADAGYHEGAAGLRPDREPHPHDLPAGDTDERAATSSGRAVPGVQVVIVGPRRHAAPGAGKTGEIWYRTPGAMLGYWRESGRHRGGDRQRGLASFRRPGLPGRGGVFADHRPDQGHDHPRRGQHQLARDGGDARAASARRFRGGRRSARRAAGGTDRRVRCGERGRAHPAELTAFLEERFRLAKQKLPEVLRVVPELPMTATGKVDKQELRGSGQLSQRGAAGSRWRENAWLPRPPGGRAVHVHARSEHSQTTARRVPGRFRSARPAADSALERTGTGDSTPKSCARPRQDAVTRMPWAAYSPAVARVRPINAALTPRTAAGGRRDDISEQGRAMSRRRPRITISSAARGVTPSRLVPARQIACSPGAAAADPRHPRC